MPAVQQGGQDAVRGTFRPVGDPKAYAMMAKAHTVYHFYKQSVDSVVAVNSTWYKYNPVAFSTLASRSTSAVLFGALSCPLSPFHNPDTGDVSLSLAGMCVLGIRNSFRVDLNRNLEKVESESVEQPAGATICPMVWEATEVTGFVTWSNGG